MTDLTDRSLAVPELPWPAGGDEPGDEAPGKAPDQPAREAISEPAGEAPGEPAEQPAPPLPLSHGQRSLWFLHQLAPEGGAYNIAAAVRVRTPLDAAALEAALHTLVDRHAVLRATFPMVAGEPCQHIADRMPFVLGREDAAAWSAARLRARLAEEAWRPFDLEHGPLLRLTLFDGGADGQVLLFVIHHIVADFWSLAVLVRELGAFYLAAAGGPPAALPPPGLPYQAHVEQERETVASARGEALLAWWRERLAGLPTLELPTDRPRPAVQTYRGDCHLLRLPPEIAAGLRARGRAGRSTLFMTLVAAFQALLGRHSGQQDLAVGSPTAGRKHAKFAGTVGYFVNPVVLRADLGGDPAFGELLARTRMVVLAALDRADYPLPLLAERLAPERDASRTPLFQVSLTLQKETRDAPGIGAFALNEEGVEVRLGGLELESLAVPRQPCPFDLVLQGVERPQGLSLALQYNADLFDASTAARWMERLATLLGWLGGGGEEELPLSAWPILPAAERHQLLHAWNDTDVAPPGELHAATPVHELVAEQARLRPEAVAVVAGDGAAAAPGTGAGAGSVLRYGELAAQAARLAWKLRELGVGPEVRVAVCAERGPARVAGVLAVLAAGGAYVSLDPAHPRERLAWLLADTAAPVALCERRFLARLPRAGTVALCLEEEMDGVRDDARPEGTVPERAGPDEAGASGAGPDEAWPDGTRASAAGPDGAWPDSGVAADNLAYVVYTSGSTGQPKGVEITHAGLANLVRWHQRLYAVGAGDRATIVASPAFDASVWELWPYLAAGASLHVPDERTRLSPPALVRWLASEEITLSFLTTPLAEAVLGHLSAGVADPAGGGANGGAGREGVAGANGWARSAAAHPESPALPALRALLAGGDRLHPWAPPGAGFRLMNHYGPSEFSVVASAGEVPPAEAGAERPHAGRLPPIGRPIDNARIYVLGDRLEPVPPGAFGELYVAGTGLARGYLRRPELTAERFLPNPWSGGPGGRMYRTGDRVRWLPSGELDFAGRLDHQVKLHGFRIELGEIESALARHPAVREAAALLREDRPGARRLAAWVTARPGQRLAGEELRAWLAARLPAFMVPAELAVLDAMPLTGNGKLDRRALGRWTPPAGAGRAVTAPRNELEEVVAGLFAEVLGVESVGVEESFFAAGGHSLGVMRLIARLRETLGVELPPHRIFEQPTVGALAQGIASATRSAAPPLVPASRLGPLPLSFAQERLWFLHQLEPASAVYNVPAAIRLAGAVDRDGLAAALSEVARRHESLRTRFAAGPAGPVQVVDEPAPVPVPAIDLAGLPPAARAGEARRLAREAALLPFDLARGPLLRAALVGLGGRGHLLLLTLHHVVSDGWSLRLLAAELGQVYDAIASGGPSPLPAFEIQYGDYALWQRQWLRGEVLAAELAHWRARLAGAPAVLDLPLDRPRQAAISTRGASRPVSLAPAVVRSFQALARRQGATLFMGLLAAFQALLSRLSGALDVSVGTPVAGRGQLRTEGLIGCFVNALVMRTRLDGRPPFTALLGRVREVALTAYAHQDLPFEKLVEELQPRRDLSYSPLFQVAFTLDGDPRPDLRLGDAVATPWLLPPETEKFDLSLILETWGAREAAAVATAERGVSGSLCYCRDLYDAATVERLAGQLVNLVAAAATHPDAAIGELDLLSAGERHQLLREWNDTRASFPATTLLHQFFEQAATRTPRAVAAVAAGRALTYAELEARVNRLAQLLRALGVGRGTPVGVWVERSLDLLVAVLATLEAGGHYVALDDAWPAERVETILARTGAPAIVAGAGQLPAVEEMRWRLPALADAVCLAVEGPEPPVEPVDVTGVRELWDFVAERAVDRETAGGFVSAFTGLPFAAAEVDRYRDRVLALAAPWLRPGARVLEIGSGSGLLLWEIAGRAAQVTGVDPSPLTQERNREQAAREGRGNVRLLTGFAHQLDELLAGAERFDLVLLASTVQFFPGPRYLERVVRQALARVAPGGALLVADVLDARRRQELRQEIERQRRQDGGDAEGAGDAFDRRQELYLDEDVFTDLGAALAPPGTAAEVAVHHRPEGFANELAFRYDVLLSLRPAAGAGGPGAGGDGGGPGAGAAHGDGPAARAIEPGTGASSSRRRKRTWTAWHVERCPAARLAPVAAPDDFAYVIHTSGSTGEPKGIVVQHRPAANLVDWINRTFAIGPEDRILFVTSLCFDLSVYDIFGVLAAGGTVEVATAAELADPDALVQALASGRITLWDSAPAALVRLAPLFPAAPAAASRLRRVLLSGDWIPVTLPDRVRQAFPGARVMALGGATEATVWSNWFPVAEVPPAWPSIPYGRPIANARYHVLDEAFGPCPIGTAGDLYIGGDCLCAGYARRPELTGAAFLPDPFAGRPGARLYRTGDRARHLADGNLQFLGRRDQQVKVRGYRIELGEIEVALARHPGVREAVVLAREDQPGDKRLVAYVVPAAPPAPEPAELREALRRSLPEFMVPAAFVTLDGLPLTPNGKLDRQALPAPAGRQDGAAATAPRTPVEEAIAAVFAEVLGRERVGIEESFFDLGGHSLLATQTVTRLRRTLGVELPVRKLFERPTVAELAAEVEAALRQGQGAEEPPLVPRPRGAAPLPLSFAQQRLWFLDRYLPGSALYNIPVAVRLSGKLDRVALRTAFAGVVRRHEALRTRFEVTPAGQPVQVVCEPDAAAGGPRLPAGRGPRLPPVAAAARPGWTCGTPLRSLPAGRYRQPLVDLARLPAAAREREALRAAGDEARRPFDLAGRDGGPLLRTTLLALGPQEHLAVIVAHHIASDGWSMGVLAHELGTLYGAALAGRLAPRELPELPVQYADYAWWQRRTLAGERLAAEVTWWRERLRGPHGAEPPALTLPADRRRPAAPSWRGAWLPVSLPAATVARLGELARARGATPFMVLLAGFEALLGRYSGQEDFALGTPVAGRTRLETEPLIGFFVNNLVLRADLSGEPTAAAQLDRVREAVLAAHAHQEVPFEKLVEELRPERHLAQTPLFQVAFVLDDLPRERLRLAGLRVEPVPLATGTAKFDLSLMLAPPARPDEGLGGGIEYAEALFDRTTVQRLAGHYQALLAALAAAPEARLWELPLLGAAERAQLLLEWNDTDSPVAGGVPRPRHLLHELVAEQARLRPKALAVAGAGGPGDVLRYSELVAKAGRMAWKLRALGVGPEVRVAVCAERGPARVAGALAVLAAGGAYVSLDPGNPRERLSWLLADAGVPVVLHERRFLTRLPEAGPAKLCLEDELAEPAAPAAWPRSGVTADNLAFVVYTSGSTGRPKGVEITHAGLANLVRWHLRRYAVTAADRATMVVNPAFDVAAWELWPYLVAGASLHVPDNDTRLSPPALLRWWAREQITISFMSTPLVDGVLAHLAGEAPDGGGPAGGADPAGAPDAEGGGGAPPLLRALLAGGDRLHRWARPEFQLINAYGPSENTVVISDSEVPTAEAAAEPRGAGRLPSIGRPIDNARVYLVDRRRQPVPLGAFGELCVAGAGVARGYLRRPELTAERFVPNPWSPEPGGRMYRTGDLVRWLPGGELDFAGRLDHQVKLHGFRIELGEIESTLAHHPAVREAVALLREERPGDPRLVAYVTAQPPQRLAADELRAWLAAHLPAYMVPAAFVVLERMPLTRNGKIDRRVLPAPAAPDAAPWKAPRTPLEEALARIFAEVLGQERVGLDDDFFLLGGHSLMVTRVTARVRSVLGVELPLRAVFEHPRVADLAAETARRRALGAAAPAVIGRRAAGAERRQLSFAQQRLWFLDRLEPQSAAYNVAAAVRLTGRLDRPVLAASFAEVVRRHEVLRARFDTADDGEPVAEVTPPGAGGGGRGGWRQPVVDLTPLPAAARQREALRAATADIRRPFDLSGRDGSPLLRTTLLALGPDEHLLTIAMHHIASDAWSMGVLVHELQELYGAALAGRPSPRPAGSAATGGSRGLPPLPIQYADFADWQRRHVAGERLAAELAWWRRQLGESPPPLALPTDRPRPAVPSRRGGSWPLALPAPAVAGLEELARARGATLFMVLVAGLAAVLGRTSGHQDFTLGTVVSGRTRLETEPLIGFFVNTLVLRADLSGEPTMAELIGRVREVVLAAQAHQEVPFEKLVEQLRPERSLAHTPLFQVLFALDDSRRRRLRLPGLEAEEVALATGTAKFDLTVTLGLPAGGGLTGGIEYAAELFDPVTIGRLGAHYQALLDAAVAAPGTPLSRLPWLTAAERHQLAVEWNDSRGDYPREALVHELVEQWARRTPEAVAVVWGDRSLTYAALDARAARLAARLRRLGARPDEPIALMLERSPLLIVTLLAVLKAGGAYAPLDPESPPERLGWLLADTGARLALADAAWGDRLRRLPARRAEVVTLGGDGEPAAADGAPGPADGAPGPADGAQTAAAPAAAAAPESLAYVMYTSGTTGRPKGVAVPHRAVVRLVRDTDYARLDAAQVLLQLAPPAFDAATLEIWGALANGGRLVLFPGTRPTLDELGAELARRQVSTLWLTAGLFQEMAASHPAGLGPVRQLLAGGDVLPPAQVRAALAARPDRVVVNGYGPTENTTFTCCHPVRHGDALGAAVPLGRPIANSRAHLLDRELQPVPIGVPGELYAAGDGLARGYLGQPGLTAERFVPDPFGGPGERLYRTGDLARRLPAGEIDFLGRIDQQVKVRGHRVEPGEVEAALAEHPAVAQAAVVAWPRGQERAAERRLVAYVVARPPAAAAPGEAPAPSPAAPPHPAELRAFLLGRLPEPMVPASFVLLPALPLTANGKLDRAALPAPDAGGGTGRHAAAAGTPPATPTEQVLAGIWAEALGLERVAMEDDFFALGGHSLLATRVAARVRATLGVELPLLDLFGNPRLADLARLIERRVAAAADRIPAAASRGSLPRASFAQQRLWFLQQLEPASPAYNIPVHAELTGTLRAGVLAQALAEVVRRHESLRTTFAVRGGEPYQRISPPAAAGAAAAALLPLADLSSLPAPARRREAERLAQEQVDRAFDLERGPLFAALLVRLDAAGHRFLLNLHHAIADGWSVGVLVRELGALYDAFRAGDPFPLPPLPIQYADYAEWQHGRLATRQAEELTYWEDRLGGEIARAELPADRPRPGVQTFTGARQLHTLDPDLTARLKSCCRLEGVTLFMALLAALQALIARHSGETDVAVGTPIAGRQRIETEGLIGCFLNTLVLRTDLSGRPSFRELLARVRTVTLEAFAHQEVPFEAVLARLQPERDLARAPLFQVLLNLLNQPPAVLTLPELEMRVLVPASLPSKFDLTLYVAEADAGVNVELVYNTVLFDAARIADLAAQLELLLRQALARPAEPLAVLSLVTAGMRQRLPDPAAPLDAGWLGAVHELFAARAEREPGRPAVVGGGEAWTYGELLLASRGVAGWLAAQGAGRGATVAIFAHRGAPLVPAILGTLTAGAAFMILDPAYPAARLVEMLGLAAPRAWIGLAAAGPVPEAAEAWLLAAGCPRLELPAAGRDAVLAALAAGPAAAEPARPVAVGAGDAACIGFTSGSTGRPRGIVGLHGSLSHFLPSYCATFGLGPKDRFTLLSALGHDPLQRDVFTPLFLGAAIVVPDAADFGIAERLVAWMNRERVTVAHLTPAMARLLTAGPSRRGAGGAPGGGSAAGAAGAAAGAPGTVTVPSLRRLLLIGEELTRRDVARLRELAPGAACFNLYGATETQRALAYHEVTGGGGEADAERARQTLPLGRGLPDAQLLVLGGEGQLAGCGELGEIVVRSPHLARGYLGEEALTAGRFGVNPSTGAAGDRIYRTGDLGRYLPDGEVAFAGRRDGQVKLRGHRIELGEIEAVLGTHPRVRAAAAVLSDAAVGAGRAELAGPAGASGPAPPATPLPGGTAGAADASGPAPPATPLPSEAALVAFVVPSAAGQVRAGELHDHLRQRLPAYMVPAAFRFLDSLPLTPAGKLDRRALARRAREAPEPGAPGGDGGRGEESRRPRTAVEEIVTGLWMELLRQPRVGLEDDFFRLGGHSINGAQMISRLREAVGVELPLRTLFEAPTPAALAAEIERRRSAPGAAARPALASFPRQRGTPPPLSFAQERFWAAREAEVRTVASTIPMMIRLEGALDVVALRRALQAVVDRHEVLRTSFRNGAGAVAQVIHPALAVRVPLVDLGHLAADAGLAEVRRLAIRDGLQAFDYERAPLFRLTLYRLSPDQHALLFVVHHVAYDGWSSSVLMREMAALYNAFRAGRSSPLAPLLFQYQDYARWQRQTVAGEALARELDFWREHLAGAAPLDLAGGRPRPRRPTFAAGIESFVVPAPLRQRLETFAAEHCASLFMVLLAAFKALLHGETGAGDMVVNCMFANRHHVETQRLIGFFAAGLPLRTRLSGSDSFRVLLARVRETTLAAHEHPEILYEPVIARTGFRADGDRGSLASFRIFFQLGEQLTVAGGLDGLAVERVPLDTGKIRQDLSLFLGRAEEPSRLAGRFKYSRDVLDGARVARMRDHFLEILAAAAGDPDRPLASLAPPGEGTP